MAQTQHPLPSRPTRTDDLVRRLQSSDTDPKEMKALDALSEEMVKVFQHECRPSYVLEAAALAPVVPASTYRNLSRAFSEAIIRGTADGIIPEPRLLRAFTLVLRCAEDATEGAEDAKIVDMELGSVLDSLRKRLKSAVEQNEPNAKYHLISTLSSVLDAMIDIKTTELSRETLHGPLLDDLATLSQDPELRLAQAASYAREALSGISDDEGPYRALLRHTIDFAGTAANIASGVSTVDPAKMFDGLRGLAGLPAFVSSMVDVVKELSGRANKQKSWYVALRFTDMLIQAKAFNYLDAFAGAVPCRQEKGFLCGLYAQLEQAWEAADPSTRDQIVLSLDQVLVPAGCKSTHWRVREWVKLLADTLNRPAWKDSIQSAPTSLFMKFKRGEYASKTYCQKTRDEALPSDLLKAAWLCCIGEQARYPVVFYADIEIRKYYQDESRLKVDRLSGERLSMDQCYINLAIVEHSNTHTQQSGDKSSPFSILHRVNVKSPSDNNKVTLQSLFSPRKLQDGSKAPPKRILIRGQAGVGKTTLCKKMVHDYLHGELWSEEHIERLLWIPLRNLKGRGALNNNLKDWLRGEYFRTGDEDVWAAATCQAVNNQGEFGKTLFILDGLDEVSRELDSSNTSGLLVDLLKQPHVIITSRPGANFAYLNRIDLELETVGFYPDQVEAYIKKTAHTQAEKIQLFVQEHWLVQGLVRIPIQLEALCYSWNSESTDSKKAPTTMTTIYQQIERRLWKKDVDKLEIRDGTTTLSQITAQSIPDCEIRFKVQMEINLLQSLAFTGIYNDVVEFDEDRREKIWAHWNDISEHLKPRGRGTLPSALNLAKLSFLRSSNPPSSEINPSYHFLHLTFQEYFAAQYFVQHWISGEKLPCLRLSSGDTNGHGKIERIDAKEFILREKYQARYDIFLRFVAGLLHSRDPENQLSRFFVTLEKEPRDLLGPVHQRLLMHCLSEAPTTPCRANLEDQLYEWLKFECNLTKQSKLAQEMEFPEQVLDRVFQGESEEIKEIILESLRERPKIPPSVMNLVASWIRDGGSRRLIIAALRMLQRPYSGLTQGIITALVALLKDPESYVRWQAAYVLGWQQGLAQDTITALVALLKDPESNVRVQAAYALGRQQGLAQDTITSLVALLKDPESYVRGQAAYALGEQQGLAQDTITALVALLKDPESYVRGQAAYALGWQQGLAQDTITALVALLKDPESDVRERAADVLGRQQGLSQEIIYRHLEPLHLVWLKQSFREHLHWCVSNELSSINTPNSLLKFYLKGPLYQLTGAIREFQKGLGLDTPVSGTASI